LIRPDGWCECGRCVSCGESVAVTRSWFGRSLKKLRPKRHVYLELLAVLNNGSICPLAYCQRCYGELDDKSIEDAKILTDRIRADGIKTSQKQKGWNENERKLYKDYFLGIKVIGYKGVRNGAY